MTHNSKKDAITFLGVIIWITVACFYLYEYFLRAVLGTIAKTFISDMGFTAKAFATINAGYYLAYSLMQIPVGFLIDRYGLRVLVILATLSCSIGSFLFGLSAGFWSAFFSRFLIGLSSSFGFVCLLYCSLKWLPRRFFAFTSGLSQLFGAVGPILAGAPVAFLMERLNNNWRSLFFIIGASGTILSLWMLFIIRNKSQRSDQVILLNPKSVSKGGYWSFLKNIQAWFTAFYAGFIYVSLPVLGVYWGTYYLQTMGFSKALSAFTVSWVWFGLLCGAPLLGRASEIFHRRKLFLILVACFGVIVSSICIYTPTQNSVFYMICFFLMGVASSGQSLSFANMCDVVDSKNQGVALGLNNSMIMLSAAVIPPLISILIEQSAKAAAAGGAVVYSYESIEKALVTLPFLYLIAALIALFGIKETFCRQQNHVHILAIKGKQGFF